MLMRNVMTNKSKSFLINEKLLQNADEKRYDQQIKVLSDISDLNKKLNSLPQEKNMPSEHEHSHEHRNENHMKLN